MACVCRLNEPGGQGVQTVAPSESESESEYVPAAHGCRSATPPGHAKPAVHGAQLVTFDAKRPGGHSSGATAVHAVSWVEPGGAFGREVGHGVHLSPLALPVPLLKWSAGHSRHETAPLSVWYVPRGHASHWGLPMTELNVPGWHGRHAAALADPVSLLNVRAGQKTQAAADAPPSTSLNVPTPQGMHVVLPVAPIVALYVPRGHSEQDVALTAAKVPAGHS